MIARSNQFESLSVARALSAVSNPLKVSDGVAGVRGMVLWERRSDGPVDYLAPNHHTLSIYLGGGNSTWSCENRSWGFSDAICLLPKGHDSRWKHNGYVKNLHLYFTDDDLAELNWSCSPIFNPVIYARNRLLHSLADTLANELDWSEPGDRLAVDHLVLAMLSQFGKTERSTMLDLPPVIQRRLEERMSALEEGPATLAELAQLANMSPRHLSRLYKATTRQTLMERQREIQVDNVKGKMACNESLLQIASDCGFSSQSHLTRVFRKATGMTPTEWRRLNCD